MAVPQPLDEGRCQKAGVEHFIKKMGGSGPSDFDTPPLWQQVDVGNGIANELPYGGRLYTVLVSEHDCRIEGLFDEIRPGAAFICRQASAVRG